MDLMPRQKFQRPTVYATGKREKLWKAEYTEYYIGADGKEHGRHKSATWSRATHTKGQAQAKCDALMQELRGSGPKADGSMTLAQFWERVYLPIRERHWTGSTPTVAGCLWRKHIEPQLGSMALKDITKATLQIHLGKLADSGLGHSTVEAVRVRLYSIFEEALDNEYVQKNPCRKVETPPCRPPEETRSLTESEVLRLFTATLNSEHPTDYLWWRVLILTGGRIGEVMALERADIRPDGLMIDEAIVRRTVKAPKRNKVRLAALPDSLRVELDQWLGTHGFVPG